VPSGVSDLEGKAVPVVALVGSVWGKEGEVILLRTGQEGRVHRLSR
jgi:hypothetical protein